MQERWLTQPQQSSQRRAGVVSPTAGGGREKLVSNEETIRFGREKQRLRSQLLNNSQRHPPDRRKDGNLSRSYSLDTESFPLTGAYAAGQVGPAIFGQSRNSQVFVVERDFRPLWASGSGRPQWTQNHPTHGRSGCCIAEPQTPGSVIKKGYIDLRHNSIKEESSASVQGSSEVEDVCTGSDDLNVVRQSSQEGATTHRENNCIASRAITRFFLFRKRAPTCGSILEQRNERNTPEPYETATLEHQRNGLDSNVVQHMRHNGRQQQRQRRRRQFRNLCFSASRFSPHPSYKPPQRDCGLWWYGGDAGSSSTDFNSHSRSRDTADSTELQRASVPLNTDPMLSHDTSRAAANTGTHQSIFWHRCEAAAGVAKVSNDMQTYAAAADEVVLRHGETLPSIAAKKTSHENIEEATKSSTRRGVTLGTHPAPTPLLSVLSRAFSFPRQAAAAARRRGSARCDAGVASKGLTRRTTAPATGNAAEVKEDAAATPATLPAPHFRKTVTRQGTTSPGLPTCEGLRTGSIRSHVREETAAVVTGEVHFGRAAEEIEGIRAATLPGETVDTNGKGSKVSLAEVPPDRREGNNGRGNQEAAEKTSGNTRSEKVSGGLTSMCIAKCRFLRKRSRRRSSTRAFLKDSTDTKLTATVQQQAASAVRIAAGSDGVTAEARTNCDRSATQDGATCLQGSERRRKARAAGSFASPSLCSLLSLAGAVGAGAPEEPGRRRGAATGGTGRETEKPACAGKRAQEREEANPEYAAYLEWHADKWDERVFDHVEVNDVEMFCHPLHWRTHCVVMSIYPCRSAGSRSVHL